MNKKWVLWLDYKLNPDLNSLVLYQATLSNYIKGRLLYVWAGRLRDYLLLSNHVKVSFWAATKLTDYRFYIHQSMTLKV